MIFLIRCLGKEGKIMNKKRIITVICSLGIAIIMAFIFAGTLNCRQAYPSKELKIFDVSINDREYKDLDITRFYKILDSNLERGDRIILKTNVSDAPEVTFPAILFRSRYTTLECYVGDKLIYEFGQDDYYRNRFLGKMYHFISLPHDYMGKDITFKMVVGENKPFNELEPMMLGSQPDLRALLVHEHLMIIFTGIFLLVFGIAFLCITLLYLGSVPEVLSFLLSSMLCVDLGIWIMTYYNLLSLFVYIPRETAVEYFTMYLIVPFCYIIMYLIQKIENKRLYLTAAGISCGITLLLYILHFVFNIHLRVTLPLYHILGIVGFALIIFYTYKNIRKKNIPPSGMIQMAGMVAFTVAEFVHLVIYILGSVHIEAPKQGSLVTISAGCLVFVLCQLANYLMFMTHTLAQRQEYDSLSRLAYADGLTNLSNRASTDRLLDDINTATDDYCIVSIDLNGLKIVNDKFGHIAGDKYIKDFAKVLTSSFGDDGFCSRIGGDEFVVILRDAASKDIDSLIGRMNSALGVLNALYPEYHRSVASGYAFRHECPDGTSSHEVYLLADQRMYENKRRMHEELGIKSRL